MTHSRDRPIKTDRHSLTNKNHQKSLEGKVMSKKIKSVISIALVVITIFSTFALTASAASYKTGQYQVASSIMFNSRDRPT